MATYKAEFLSHYYEGTAAAAPRLCDGLDLLVGAAGVDAAAHGQLRVARARRLGGCSKWLGGIDEKRDDAALCPSRPSRVGGGGARASRPGARRSSCGPTPSTTTFIPKTGIGRRRGARGGRLRGAGARAVAVLRPAALRLRHARPRQDAAATDPRHAPRRHRGGHAARRARAELRGRLPRRAVQPVARGSGREAAQVADLPPERVPRRPRLAPAASARAQGACPRPLPSQVGARFWQGGIAAA